MPMNTEATLPAATLCVSCTRLNLSPTDFYLPEDEAKSETNGDKLYVRKKIDSRPWQDIEGNTNCGLCQMIRRAVEEARSDWQLSEVPHTCELSTRRLREFDGWGQDYGGPFDARNLEIVAHYDWTSSDPIALLPVESAEYPGCFPGRIVDPTGIDVQRIKGWIKQCQQTHGNECRHFETVRFGRLQGYMLVFDVEDTCLVTLPSAARYIALSYVWGNVEQPTTLGANINSFKQQNGLSPVYKELPKVVLDAVSLVRSLGERYLWVDTLCIIQDNEAWKERLINSMHIVYENAYLTLFATFGADSNAGLPGVRPNSRRASQLVTKLSNGLTLSLPFKHSRIQYSKWASRGWTYQEYFFAKRRLIFVDGQVVYQCRKVRWREDIAQEHFMHGLGEYQVDGAGNRTFWSPPHTRFAQGPWQRDDLNRYVQAYLDRDLTFDDDILSAFAGVLNEAKQNNLVTCWGLTGKHFGMDILWMPAKWLARRPGFPSWSWSGWKGPVIPYRSVGVLPYESIWTQRKSWIHWYIYRKHRATFELWSLGYHPQAEDVVTREEAFHQGVLPGELIEPKGSDSMAYRYWMLCGNDSAPIGKHHQPILLDPPFPLSGMTAIEVPPPRTSFGGFVRGHSIKGISVLLLFRTFTAFVGISTLNPRGLQSPPPRGDHLALPSARTLHLYAADGAHIGCAWAHTQELFDKIAEFDKIAMEETVHLARFQIEVAIVAGALQGDWRTRIECASTEEYMYELVEAGQYHGHVDARYERKSWYEQCVMKVYDDMMRERQRPEIATEAPLATVDQEGMKKHFETIGLKKTFPGHSDETLHSAIERSIASRIGMRAKKGQRYMKVFLLQVVGDNKINGTGCIQERVGIGDIRDDALDLIPELAVRDVVLQ